MDAQLTALNRFGLGPRPRDILPADPKAWLLGQIDRYQPALPGADRLASRGAIAKDLGDYVEKLRAGKIDPTAPAAPAPMDGAAMSAMTPAANPAPGSNPAKADRAEARDFAREQYIAQVGARVRSAVATDTPFAERLVHFWANHFAVSADKLTTIAMAGMLEIEAIRPHVMGRFADMLLAVEQHPAMLLYLDQAQSVGPESMLGQRAGRSGRPIGLNENLGREILELHTLGVRTGYSQADVTEFARALTGWTVAGVGRGPLVARLENGAAPGAFFFAPAIHQPGPRTILGKSYGQEGEAQARAVLADLARHPATARHLATKLARHFVADDPPPALVARLETAYLRSDGDLPTVYRALIDAPEAWAAAPAKFRSPWLWGVAVLRGVHDERGDALAKAQDRTLVGLFSELGQPVWRPGSPAGFDDVGARWAAPDALLRRVELAGRISSQAPAMVDARALADRLFGAGLSPETRQGIANADTPKQGLALMMVAPEMMRA